MEGIDHKISIPKTNTTAGILIHQKKRLDKIFDILFNSKVNYIEEFF